MSHSFERWNGGGVPDRLAGEEIPAGSRLTMVASVAAMFQTVGGRDAAVTAVRDQAGSVLDPDLADHFARRAEPLLAELDAIDPRALVIEAEPGPPVEVTDDRLGSVAAVFGDIVDLKTPYTHGHARGVAALARSAGEPLGLSAADAGFVDALVPNAAVQVREFPQVIDVPPPSPTDPRELARITAPVLLLGGTRSEPGTWFSDGIRHCAEHIRGAQVATIDGAGHLGPILQPEAVAGVVTDFLATAVG